MKQSELRARHSFQYNQGLVYPEKMIETKKVDGKKNAGTTTDIENINIEFFTLKFDKENTGEKSSQSDNENLK
jgi:hypothetical protein